MKHLNLILALLCLFFWITLYVVYYHEKLFPWLVNRFTRDKLPKDAKVENGYFSDGMPIPFRNNLYPSSDKTDNHPTEETQQSHDEATKPDEKRHD